MNIALNVIHPSPPRLHREVGLERKCCYLDDEIIHFGIDGCNALLDHWQIACANDPSISTYNYWKSFRAFLRVVGQGACLGEDISFVILAKALVDRNSCDIDLKVLKAALEAYGNLLWHEAENTISEETRSPDTLAKNFEATRTACKRLAEVGYLPECHVRTPKFKRTFKVKTQCLAMLRQAKDGRSVKASEPAVFAAEMIKLNIRMLDELRRMLVQEFCEEYQAFIDGRRWISDFTDDALHKFEINMLSVIRTRNRGKTLSRFNSHEDFLPTVVAYVNRFHGSLHPYEGLPGWLRAVIENLGYIRVARHLEATGAALNAAFHIVLIDSALNEAPCWELARAPFPAPAKHGRRSIATVALLKARASGLIVEGVFRAEEADLDVKRTDGGISSIQVIERWTEMTEPFFTDANAMDLSEVRLWDMAMGRPNDHVISCRKSTLAAEWWPAFLRRHAENPLIGDLKIDRRTIKQTNYTIRSASVDFHPAFTSALLNHDSPTTTLRYMSQNVVRSMLAAEIRSFQQRFEATLVFADADIAAKLGLSLGELNSRKVAGISTGLGFLCLDRVVPAVVGFSDDKTLPDSCTTLSDCSRCSLLRFVPTEMSMRQLALARLAFRKRQDEVLIVNPERWLRLWLPHHALVEAYCELLLASRFKTRFQNHHLQVQNDVAGGLAFLPIIR